MKKYILLLIALIGLSSCDFLDKTPKDKLAPENYFRNEEDFKLFSNSFYDDLFSKDAFEQQSDIFVNKGSLPNELLGGSARQIPGSGGGWSWSQLRKINTMLGNMDKCDDPKVVEQYTGLAKFFRARFYYEKIKRFGDVPWYDKELGSKDPELYKPRDSREYVMSKMLEDIDFAIDALPKAVSTFRVNKWAALALKAEFCLFEGTYRKYHGLTFDEGYTADEYLTLAAEAAEQVMNCNLYKLAPDYGKLFREVDADENEYILAIKRDLSIGCTHNATTLALMATQGTPGFTKKFVDSFLMKDGSRFTDKEGWETMPFIEEMEGRDPRLGMIMRLPSYVRETAKYTQKGPQLSLTSTGYQFDKFVMSTEHPDAETKTDMSYNDLPVYRLGEIYLIYAEAKAELGTLTQDDVDKSINKLRDRVGMERMELATLTVDPYLTSAEYGYTNLANFGHSNLAAVLEIRRERTIELAMEGKRWDDIRRWKEGACYKQHLYGIYFEGPGSYDLNADGVADICLYTTAKAPVDLPANVAAFQIQEIEIDGKYVPQSDGIILSEGTKGYVDMHKLKTLAFDETRDYLYPIPISERTLNQNLTQNPGWNDGLSF